MSIAKNLHNLRRAAKLTQTELGDAIGVGQPAVSKWERGEAEPSASDLPKIARLVGASVEVLLQGVDAQYDAGRDLIRHTSTGKQDSHLSKGESVDPASARIRELEDRGQEYETVLRETQDVARKLLARLIGIRTKSRPAIGTQSRRGGRHRKTG